MALMPCGAGSTGLDNILIEAHGFRTVELEDDLGRLLDPGVQPERPAVPGKAVRCNRRPVSIDRQWSGGGFKKFEHGVHHGR